MDDRQFAARQHKDYSPDELERMLFDVCEHVIQTLAERRKVAGLDEWFQAVRDARKVEKRRLREQALAKLTEDERKALGI